MAAPRAPAERSARLAQFVVALERAEAEAEVSLVAVIRRRIGGGDGRLALEVLARNHPDRWGKNRVVASKEPLPVEESVLDLSRLSNDEYQQLKELHRRASGS